MKKLALLLLGALLGFLLCYFYFYSSDVNDVDIKVNSVENMVPPKPSKGLISPTIISKLDKAFDERHNLINKGLGIMDNRSSWYSLDDVRKYLDYAEYQAKTTTNYTMDGVRLYLGVNKGLTTIMFVPTSSDITQGKYKSKGNMFNFTLKRRKGGGDIKSLEGMDFGEVGDPPNANYRQ